MSATLRILLIEDDLEDTFLIEKLLSRTGKQDVVNARTLEDAVRRLAHESYDLILTDLSLPDSDGALTAKRIIAAAGDVPIVVLTGSLNSQLGCDLISAGAQDYLPKSQLEPVRLRQVVTHALERQRLWSDARHAALHDGLTKLPNRTLLTEHLNHALEDARRRGERLALAYLDLDGFKAINDTYGHKAGDVLLQQVAERLNAGIRKVDMVARLGGDELVWSMPMIADPFTALGRVEWMLKHIIQPYALPLDAGEQEVTVGASIGVSLYPDHADSADELIGAADVAMYRAKREGGNNIKIHGASLEDLVATPALVSENQATRDYFQLRVLLVEDDPEDRLLVEKVAREAIWDWHIEWARSLKDAFRAARGAQFDVALLDLNLPDSSGIDTVVRFVRALPALPIVILTHSADDPLGLLAIKEGAQDFLSKALPDLAFWPKAARYAIERHGLVQQSNAATLRARIANTDMLTGLPNRREFQGRLDELLTSHSTPPPPFSLVIIDLVHFQGINQRLGYLVGDAVLRIVGTRLRAALSQEQFVVRLGGDEFAVLLFGYEDEESLQKELKDIVRILCHSMTVEERLLRLCVRIGIAHYPEHGVSASALMRAADLALRRVKEDGSKTVAVYKSAYGEQAEARRKVEALLRASMHDGGIKLLFQPIVDARSGELRHLEALLRWRGPDSGTLVPAQFMSVAESSGLIAHIDILVLREVCRLSRDWLPIARRVYPGLSIALNVSAVTINTMDYADAVYWMLDEYGLTEGRPDIEITESALSTDLTHTLDQIARIDQLGLRVSLDDFGAEYSSLNYLRTLPVRTLKIDRSFISELPGRERDMIIVDSLIELATRLNFQVIVEGIETEEQRELVARHDGALLQGYLVARPAELEDLCEIFGIEPLIARRV